MLGRMQQNISEWITILIRRQLYQRMVSGPKGLWWVMKVDRYKESKGGWGYIEICVLTGDWEW